MNHSTIDAPIEPGVTPKPRFLARFARRAVLARLERLRRGRLTLVEGGQTLRFGRAADDDALDVIVRVYNARFYSDIAFGGSIGAGEAYMQGYWSTDDLTALVRLLLQNRDLLDGLETGLARLAAPAQQLLHRLNRNTLAGSRRNIAAHYDLGNDFFRLFLDETMMYSSAIFERPTMTLREAQLARLDRICRKLDLKPSDHLLEIGTGWGGFALYAARHFGCRITTTTISRQQYDLAVERIRAVGLSDRVAVLLADYRDLTGRFDKLVSIEMIEAVGCEYYDAYFGKCAELLKPDGMMLLQAITIADQCYERAKKSVDFIQRYIFPGSCIPSVAALAGSIARAADLRLFHLDDIGPHYATTLRKWRENFFANLNAVKALGYPDTFLRMWEFYLCYCEGGFAERALGDVQMLLVKPENRRAPLLKTEDRCRKTAPLTRSSVFCPLVAP
jgi:cyclopropane-fatty-acyl-phospholipid synthase